MKIVKIGRSSSNDVNINDGQVSRSHCQIIQDDYGRFTLIDTNSTNGTYINGTRRHGEVRLNQSDIVRIGNTTLPWQTYFNNTVGGTEIGGGRTVAGGGYGVCNNNDNQNNIHIDFGGLNGNTPPPYAKPSSFLAWAIIATLFFFLPFGIVSIVYASKVNGLWYSGQYDEAYRAASNARTWFWWSFAIAILYYAFIVLLATGVIKT